MASPLTTAISNTRDYMFPLEHEKWLKQSSKEAYKEIFYNAKKDMANMTRLSVSTANDALRKALANAMSEAYEKKHGKLAQSQAVANIQQEIIKVNKIAEDFKKQQDRTQNRDWGAFSAFNPFLWRDAFADLTSENQTGIVGKLARKMTGGMTSEQLYFQNVGDNKSKDLEAAAAAADDINKEFAKEEKEDKEKSSKDIQTEQRNPVTLATTDGAPLSVFDTKTNDLLNQVVKFLAPANNKQTYNLEQQAEAANLQNQQFTTLQDLAENVKTITAVVAKTPIAKKESDQAGDLLPGALAAGGSGLLSIVTDVGSALSGFGSKVFRLLTIFGGPITKLAGKIVDKLGLIVTSKVLARALDAVLDGRRGGRGGKGTPTVTKDPPLTPANNKKPANQPDKPLTSKQVDTVKPTTTTSEPLKAPDGKSAANSKVLTTGSKTVDGVKTPIPKTTPSSSNFKNVSVKGAGKLLGVAGTMFELGATAIDIKKNNDEIDQRVAAGELTADQASDLKVKQGTQMAASSAVSTGAAVAGGMGAVALLPLLGLAASGPVGWIAALAGGAAAAAGAGSLMETDIGKAVTEGIGDLAVSIKNWWNDQDDETPKVTAANTNVNLTPADAAKAQANTVTPAQTTNMGSAISQTAFKQQQAPTSGNIDASSRVNNVSNVTNNSEVVYNGMSATDNYGYSRVLRDPRIVGVADY